MDDTYLLNLSLYALLRFVRSVLSSFLSTIATPLSLLQCLCHHRDASIGSRIRTLW